MFPSPRCSNPPQILLCFYHASIENCCITPNMSPLSNVQQCVPPPFPFFSPKPLFSVAHSLPTPVPLTPVVALAGPSYLSPVLSSVRLCPTAYPGRSPYPASASASPLSCVAKPCVRYRFVQYMSHSRVYYNKRTIFDTSCVCCSPSPLLLATAHLVFISIIIVICFSVCVREDYKPCGPLLVW